MTGGSAEKKNSEMGAGGDFDGEEDLEGERPRGERVGVRGAGASREGPASAEAGSVVEGSTISGDFR